MRRTPIGLKYAHFLAKVYLWTFSEYEPPRGVGGVSSKDLYLRDFWTKTVYLRLIRDFKYKPPQAAKILGFGAKTELVSL